MSHWRPREKEKLLTSLGMKLEKNLLYRNYVTRKES